MADETNVTSKQNLTDENAFRSALIVGQGEDGSLVPLDDGNTFMYCRFGQGGATCVASFMVNMLMWNGPKELRLWVSGDKCAGEFLLEDWAKLVGSNTILAEYTWSDEKDKVLIVLEAIERFYSQAVLPHIELQKIVDAEGIDKLNADQKYEYDRKRVLMLNMLLTGDEGMQMILIALRKVFEAQKADNGIGVVISNSDWIPDQYTLNECFNNVVCTPCSTEASWKLLGSSIAGDSKVHSGVVWFKRRDDKVQAIKIKYRPDSFIRKLIKAFKVKGKNK